VAHLAVAGLKELLLRHVGKLELLRRVRIDYDTPLRQKCCGAVFRSPKSHKSYAIDTLIRRQFTPR
jgi:hypothetical protein